MQMMQKKQVMILSVLFGLLLLTGYLNFKFNNKTSGIVNSDRGGEKAVSANLPEHENSASVSASSATFFADFRSDRERVRNKELENLNSLIENESTEKEVLARAQEQKMEVASAMEKESTIEGLLKSNGFSDAVVTIRKGSINVVVDEKEINEQKAAQILDIVQRETGEDSSNIKVLPKG